MICDKCKNIICMNAFTTTSCERCGKDIVMKLIDFLEKYIFISDEEEGEDDSSRRKDKR